MRNHACILAKSLSVAHGANLGREKGSKFKACEEVPVRAKESWRRSPKEKMNSFGTSPTRGGPVSARQACLARPTG